MFRLSPFRLALVGMGIGLCPSLTLATAPAITGLSAVEQNGQIRVSWTAPAEPVSAYRVYYSRQSILTNGGKYDDFEAVAGNRTEYILSTFPAADRLFVSVLATGANGEVGQTFSEEVPVDLPKKNATTQSSAAVSFDDAMAFRLLNATAVSATGVTLTFNMPIVLSDADAPRAFRIEYGSGFTVALRRLAIADTQVTIDSDRLYAGTAYTVHVSDVVRGQGSDNATIPLGANGRTAQFTGLMSGPAPSTATPQSAPPVISKPPPKKTPLAQSGPGVLLLIGTAGAAAGWAKTRRKTKKS